MLEEVVAFVELSAVEERDRAIEASIVAVGISFFGEFYGGVAI